MDEAQRDAIADADVDFRAAVERLSDFLKGTAIGSMTWGEINEVGVYLADARIALTHLGWMTRKHGDA